MKRRDTTLKAIRRSRVRSVIVFSNPSRVSSKREIMLLKTRVNLPVLSMLEMGILTLKFPSRTLSATSIKCVNGFVIRVIVHVFEGRTFGFTGHE